MNQLIKKFIENKSEYDQSMESLLNKELTKTHDKKEFSSILAILGKKHIKEGNYSSGQYLASQILNLSANDKLVITKEHGEIIDYFEKISQLQFRNFKKKILITSLILSLAMFLIFHFVGKLDLEQSLVLSVGLFLIDNYLFKKNKEKLFHKRLNTEMNNLDHSKLDKFIDINTNN